MTSSVTTNWDSLILHRVNPTGKEIGRGAYGRVFEVNYEGTLCAAKEVHALLLQYAQGEDLEKIRGDFLSECQIWSMLRHPCVVQFIGSETDILVKLVWWHLPLRAREFICGGASTRRSMLRFMEAGGATRLMW